ncbi:MAG: hypothetical protein ACW99A_13400 [Candidatus Kariarchaeaceae archaeon]
MYRSAANTLKTDDSFTIGSNLTINGGYIYSGTTNMYIQNNQSSGTINISTDNSGYISFNYNKTSAINFWNSTTVKIKIDDNINMNLPTSSAGLASGDLWNDSGTVKIV